MNLKHPPCRMLLQRPLNWCPISVDRLKNDILLEERVTQGCARPAKRWISSHTGLLDQCCATKAVKLIKGFVRSSGSDHPELQEEMLHKYNIEMPEKWARQTDNLKQSKFKVCDIEQRRSRVKPRCALINEVMNKYNWAEFFRQMERPGWRQSKMNALP